MQPIILHNGTVLYPFIKINPTYSVIYDRSDNQKPRSESQNQHFAAIKDKDKFTGTLSKKSKQKIRTLINWLLCFADEQTIQIDNKTVTARLSFVTLTLPSKQQHTDNYLKNCCINQLLTELRVLYPEFLYVAKYEKQKNGNFHTHIISNLLIHYKIIQDIWNRILDKLGYVKKYSLDQKTKYKNGFYFDLHLFEKYKTTRVQQFDRYMKGLRCGWSEPHTTEIKACYNIDNVAAYLAEYIAKTDPNAEFKITGRIWSCSKKLESLSLVIPLEGYDIDFSNFKRKSTTYATVLYTDILTLCETPLRNEIITKLNNHFAEVSVN